MADKTVVNNGGIGVLGLLGIVFVTLKLTGFINWSWWWVTAPFWGGLALVLAVVVIVLLLAVCGTMIDAMRARRRARR